jgi:hypothetical protein
MDNDLLAYIEWVELETFFSGFLLVYAIVYLLSAKQSAGFIKIKILPLLPLSYALIAKLYWGLQFKNWYPDYNINHIISGIHYPYLKLWALLAIFFWLPILRKKFFLAAIHSSIFFFLIIKDIALQILSKTPDYSTRNNDLKIYAASIGIHITALVVVLLVFLLLFRLKKKKKATTMLE